jgi:thiamine-phosphate pyrophosphorylase
MPVTLPRIYPILDTASLDRARIGTTEAAEAFLEGGAEILQLRHKSFWTRETFAEAERIAALCRAAHALFIVNDRADYAALLGAGLHLGQEDLSPTDARLVVGPDAITGLSTHNSEQIRAAEAEPVDYLAFGPVFATNSKRTGRGARLHSIGNFSPAAARSASVVRAFSGEDRPDRAVGIEGLRAGRALTRKPLVAIGGITRDNASTCWSAGADSVAIIADLIPLSCTKTTLRNRMTEWQSLTPR